MLYFAPIRKGMITFVATSELAHEKNNWIELDPCTLCQPYFFFSFPLGMSSFLNWIMMIMEKKMIEKMPNT